MTYEQQQRRFKVLIWVSNRVRGGGGAYGIYFPSIQGKGNVNTRLANVDCNQILYSGFKDKGEFRRIYIYDMSYNQILVYDVYSIT